MCGLFLAVISILSVGGVQADGYRRDLRRGYQSDDEPRRNLQFQLNQRPTYEMPSVGGDGGGWSGGTLGGGSYGGGFGGQTIGGSGGWSGGGGHLGYGGYVGGGGFVNSGSPWGSFADPKCLGVKCEEGFYCENGECVFEPQVAIGRPFVDKSGKSIESSYNMHYIPSWSSNCPTDIGVASSNDENISETIHSLGKEWTKRALGEYASIASFAAFTMALMSNQAPPKLIADAIVAAKDEHRHAQTSFEIASLLLGKPIEPEAIPPSSHEFGHNITALALATAEEGCIGETLSTLAAANEVDVEIDLYKGIHNDTKMLLKEKMQEIVKEESRHAMLAWNTILWACTQDDNACKTVLKRKFAPGNLNAALHRYFPDNAALRAEGEKIFQRLFPLIDDDKVNNWGDCNAGAIATEFNFNEKLVGQFVDVIVNGVICSE